MSSNVYDQLQSIIINFALNCAQYARDQGFIHKEKTVIYSFVQFSNKPFQNIINVIVYLARHLSVSTSIRGSEKQCILKFSDFRNYLYKVFK